MLTDGEKMERIRAVVDDTAGWELAANQLQSKLINILNGNDEKVEARTKVERVTDAKNVIAKAIQSYQDVIHENEFVTAWVVLTERQSIELIQNNQSAVGVVVPTGQSFVTSRGLLEIGLDTEKRSIGAR